MTRCRLSVLLCVVLTAMLFSGCSIDMDVEALLRPPNPTGEQKKIQQALEKYINSEKKVNTPDAAGGYVLKYPKSGDYRSAFVLKDLDGDGEQEAIVFYGRSGERSNNHLNLLKKIEEGWQSIYDVEGPSPDIDRIQFGDMNKDGILEILTGWNIVNVRDRQLIMYSVKKHGLEEMYRELYSEFVVGKLTDSGKDNLLILHSNLAENITTAMLLTAEIDKVTGKQVLIELDSTRLDGQIEQFSSPKIAAVDNNISGVYVDGSRSGGMVTELIYWDGTQLRTPFYNSVKDITETTYRSVPLPSMNLDGDEYIEWPLVEPVKGFSNPATNKVWLTKWQYWDGHKQEVVHDFSSVVNLTDRYHIITEKSWDGLFTFLYEKNTHTLSLYNLKNGIPEKKILIIQAVYKSGPSTTTTVSTNQSSDLGQEESIMRELKVLPDVKYMVWFSDDKPFNFNMDRVVHMFAVLQ